MYDDLGLSILASIPHNPAMIITYTHAHKHTKSRHQQSSFQFEKKRRKKRRGQRRDGVNGKRLTDAHSGQDKIIIHTTAYSNKRLGFHKVYPVQLGVARLQTPKIRTFYGMRIIQVKRLRCLLRRALCLARVFVLGGKHWNCCDLVHD